MTIKKSLWGVDFEMYKDGKWVKNIHYVCFSFLHCWRKYKEDCDSIVFFFRISPDISKELLEEFLNEMSKLNMFRYGEISHTRAPHTPFKHHEDGSKYLSVEVNPNKIVPMEVFLFGQTLRTLYQQPQVIKQWHKLCELKPDIDRFQLLLIAHCIKHEDDNDFPRGDFSHALCSTSHGVLTGKTISDYLELCDKYFPKGDVEYYTPSTGFTEFFFTFYFIVNPSSGRRAFRDINKSLEFSDELFESFFNKELFLSSYIYK